MANTITNNLLIWGSDNDYGSTWYSISNERIEGFRPNSINYASKMNQALANATLLPYMFMEILKENYSLGTDFTVDAREIPTNNYLSSLKSNLKNAINSYICSKAGTVDNATQSRDSEYANKIGTYSSHPAIGSNIKPVYVDANGTINAGKTYAGGTNITLNGTPKSESTASFYAPETLGTNNTYLKSNGIGLEWVNIASPGSNNVSTGNYITVQNDFSTATTDDDFKSYLLIPKKGGSIEIKQYYSYKVSTTPHANSKITTFYGPIYINFRVYGKRTANASTLSPAYIRNIISYGTTQSLISAEEDASGQVIVGDQTIMTDAINYIQIKAIDNGFTWYDYTNNA